MMIPTKQNIVHDPENGKNGNCLSAVLASLLHLPIDEIPVFSEEKQWVKGLNAWLRQFGLAFVLMPDTDFLETHGINGVWHEMAGITSRFKDIEHSCVAKDGVLVFDPSIYNTGLQDIRTCGFLIMLEPWKVVPKIEAR